MTVFHLFIRIDYINDSCLKENRVKWEERRGGGLRTTRKVQGYMLAIASKFRI